LALYIWGAHSRHMANTTEPFVCGSDRLSISYLAHRMVGQLKRVEMRRSAKFCRNRSKRGRYMAIFRFSRWRPPPSWIFKFLKF